MAMIKCPDCGKTISDAAPVCPNCGYSFLYALPNKKKAKENVITLIVGLLTGLVLPAGATLVILFGGAIIEFIVVTITIFMMLLVGSRSVRVIRYFFFFDIGFLIGFLVHNAIGW